MASVPIATIQAPIPQSSPLLRFAATLLVPTLLVPCPFALQPHPTSIHGVAEQTLISQTI